MREVVDVVGAAEPMELVAGSIQLADLEQVGTAALSPVTDDDRSVTDGRPVNRNRSPTDLHTENVYWRCNRFFRSSGGQCNLFSDGFRRL